MIFPKIFEKNCHAKVMCQINPRTSCVPGTRRLTTPKPPFEKLKAQAHESGREGRPRPPFPAGEPCLLAVAKETGVEPTQFSLLRIWN